MTRTRRLARIVDQALADHDRLVRVRACEICLALQHSNVGEATEQARLAHRQLVDAFTPLGLEQQAVKVRAMLCYWARDAAQGGGGGGRGGGGRRG